MFINERTKNNFYSIKVRGDHANIIKLKHHWLGMEKNQEMIVEEGEYNLIANTDKDFKITHLVLKASNGSKRVWRIQELTEKDVSFKIEKFS